jgi:hypothetical protein
LIDALGISQNGDTLNEISGPGTKNGILTLEDIIALAASPVNPTTAYTAIFVFPVHNALSEREDLYAATRAAWLVSADKRTLRDAKAVALAGGISRGVFEIQSWKSSNIFEGKFEFVGNFLNNHELEHKNWLAITTAARGFWQRGNYLIVTFDGHGKFKFLHGSSDKETWRNLV